MRYCLLIILLALGDVPLYAQIQPVSYPFNCIGTGFMWFGTRTGPRHDAADSLSIGENTVKLIFEGPCHKLWIQFEYASGGDLLHWRQRPKRISPLVKRRLPTFG